MQTKYREIAQIFTPILIFIGCENYLCKVRYSKVNQLPAKVSNHPPKEGEQFLQNLQNPQTLCRVCIATNITKEIVKPKQPQNKNKISVETISVKI